MIHTKKADFEKIAKEFNISPVLARIIRNRDVVDYKEINAYLNGEIGDMHSPHLLKDIDKSAEIVLEKIRDKNQEEECEEKTKGALEIIFVHVISECLYFWWRVCDRYVNEG